VNTCGDCYHCRTLRINSRNHCRFVGCAKADDSRAIILARSKYDEELRLAAKKFLTSHACRAFVDMRADASKDWQPPKLDRGPMRPKIDKWVAQRTAENARLLKLRVEAKAEKGCQRLSGRPARSPSRNGPKSSLADPRAAPDMVIGNSRP